MDAPVLERLRAGFFTSAHTPNAMTAIAREEFGAIPRLADPHYPAAVIHRR
jgi:hypothetical protein